MAKPISGVTAKIVIAGKEVGELLRTDIHDYKTCGKKRCPGCVITLAPVPPVAFTAEVALNVEKWYSAEEWDRLTAPPVLLRRDDAEWDF